MTKDFRHYYLALNDEQRQSFADSTLTTKRYIDSKLLNKNRSKRPGARRGLMRSLAEATNGELSYADMVDYFYGENEEQAA